MADQHKDKLTLTSLPETWCDLKRLLNLWNDLGWLSKKITKLKKLKHNSLIMRLSTETAGKSNQVPLDPICLLCVRRQVYRCSWFIYAVSNNHRIVSTVDVDTDLLVVYNTNCFGLSRYIVFVYCKMKMTLFFLWHRV